MKKDAPRFKTTVCKNRTSEGLVNNQGQTNGLNRAAKKTHMNDGLGYF